MWAAPHREAGRPLYSESMTVLADRRVAAYWARQVGVLESGVARVLAGDLSAVHPTRVSLRRMRSTLRTFAPVFDPRAVERLDHELEWLAAELGTVRDREVLLGMFTARPDLDDELREPLLTVLAEELEQHGRRLREVLAEERVRLLVEHLRATVDDPPPTTEVDLEACRASARRILAKRLCRAGVEDEPERMHSARKAAKRVRYAAEIVAGDAVSLPEPLPPLSLEVAQALTEVRRAERLQDGLGHCQDLVVARDYLLSVNAEHPVVPGRPSLALARTLADERLASLVAVDRSDVCCEPGTLVEAPSATA